MKEVRCSAAVNSVLNSAKQILEVAFGQIDLKCFTIAYEPIAIAGIDRYEVNGKMECSPQRSGTAKFDFRMVINMTGSEDSPTPSPVFAHYLFHKQSGENLAYTLGVVSTFTQPGEKSSVRVRFDKDRAWLAGTSANNRWVEPLDDGDEMSVVLGAGI